MVPLFCVPVVLLFADDAELFLVLAELPVLLAEPLVLPAVPVVLPVVPEVLVPVVPVVSVLLLEPESELFLLVVDPVLLLLLEPELLLLSLDLVDSVWLLAFVPEEEDFFPLEQATIPIASTPMVQKIIPFFTYPLIFIFLSLISLFVIFCSFPGYCSFSIKPFSCISKMISLMVLIITAKSEQNLKGTLTILKSASQDSEVHRTSGTPAE